MSLFFLVFVLQKHFWGPKTCPETFDPEHGNEKHRPRGDWNKKHLWNRKHLWDEKTPMNKKHLVYFCSSNLWLQPTPMHVPLFCSCFFVCAFSHHPCLLAQTLAGTHVRSVDFGHGRIFVLELWPCFSGNALRSLLFLKESRWCLIRN